VNVHKVVDAALAGAVAAFLLDVEAIMESLKRAKKNHGSFKFNFN
jgi:hypothetical protein